jgi:hypothetical protein
MGEFEHVDALLDEGYRYAVEMNEPVVLGFIVLQKAALVGLRDEDYRNAEQLVKAGFPPGSPTDLNAAILGLAGTVVGCGLGDFRLLQPFATFVSNMGDLGTLFWELPVALPCRLSTLMDQGQYARAAELLSALLTPVAYFWGQPFPTDWLKRWAWIHRLEAQMETALGADGYQAAQARGATLSAEELIREVHLFLDSLLPSASS